MSRVLVTGATGFIGSRLATRLIDDGADVTCLVRNPARAADLEPCGARLVAGDLRNPDAVRAAVAGNDVVYHLAGMVTAFRQQEMMATNADGFRTLMTACADCATPPMLVSVSSLAAAGPSSADRPRTESDPARPVSNYGRTKRAAELIAEEFAGQVPITIVRPPIVFGEGDQNMLSLFRSIFRLGVHLAFGVAYSRYSLIHVSDLVDAMILTAQSGERLARAHRRGRRRRRARLLLRGRRRAADLCRTGTADRHRPGSGPGAGLPQLGHALHVAGGGRGRGRGPVARPAFHLQFRQGPRSPRRLLDLLIGSHPLATGICPSGLAHRSTKTDRRLVPAAGFVVVSKLVQWVAQTRTACLGAAGTRGDPVARLYQAENLLYLRYPDDKPSGPPGRNACSHSRRTYHGSRSSGRWGWTSHGGADGHERGETGRSGRLDRRRRVGHRRGGRRAACRARRQRGRGRRPGRIGRGSWSAPSAAPAAPPCSPPATSRDEAEVAASLDQSVEQFGGLQIVVNCAGIVHVAPLDAYSADDWDALMAVNVKSIFLAVKHALAVLKRNRRSYVVNVGSVSSLVAQAGTPAYTASKGAVLQLSRSIALDYAAIGLRCNCVCPGITDTPMLRYHLSKTPDPEATLAERLRRVPTGVAVQPRRRRPGRAIPGLRGFGRRHRHVAGGRRRLPGGRRVAHGAHPLHGPLTRGPGNTTPMRFKLACADFTFPLLEHDAALDVIALLGFDGVDIGLFEGRSHLWPSRVFPDGSLTTRASCQKKLGDRGLRAADVFLQTAPEFVSLAPNHPDASRRRKARELFQRTLEFRRRRRQPARLGVARGAVSRGAGAPIRLREPATSWPGGWNSRGPQVDLFGRGPRRLDRAPPGRRAATG